MIGLCRAVPGSRYGCARATGLRLVACLVATVMLTGACTTVRPSQLPPDALQSGIRSGALVQPGDSITVVTADGMEHAVVVSSSDSEAIRGASPDGDPIAVPISEVVALRKREIEPVRTTFAALGAAWMVALVVLVVEIFDTL